MARYFLPLAALIAFAAALSAADKPPAGITVDKEKKTVTVDAKVSPRKVLDSGEVYPIEVIACWGKEKKGKKAHETVVTIDVLPSDVAKAVESLGVKPGTPAVGEGAKAVGPEVIIAIQMAPADGGKRLTIDKILVDPKTNKPMPKVKFHFTGSGPSKVPGKPDVAFGADTTGSLIMLFPVDAETVFQSAFTMKEEKYLKLDVKKDALPTEGTPVKLVIELTGK
jgi:hypothetical protein